MSVASRGTHRGSRGGVRDRDGVNVERLRGDKNTDDARVHDQQVASRLDSIEELLGRLVDQMSLITEVPLGLGERLDE